MSKDKKKEPEMIKDSSVTNEMAKLKAQIKELKAENAELRSIVAKQDERIKRLEDQMPNM